MLVEGGGGGVVSPPSSSPSWDLEWFLQFLFSALLVAVGLHTLLKNTASKYFEVNDTFEGDQQHRHRNSNNASRSETMPGVIAAENPCCAACGAQATKKCSRCKSVRYCSEKCQGLHWKSGHKDKCKGFQDTRAVNSTQNGTPNGVLKPVAAGGRSSSIALIPSSGSVTSRPIKIKQPKDVLFPYDEFVKFFNWEKPGFPPCGLLNCGNSCFANVVLQCLSFTRPLVAYLLEKGHRSECGSNDWCFLCEFEAHVERTRLSKHAFSPTCILSRLSNIGGTLGYGRQEDAHEFMRFSIDAMQSACLDEFGGEKAIPPKLQETTLIQHIFGGRLQSEVICTKCEKISNQYENMMDLTVEIQGDAASLEECLDQFTVKEWLHGENMYKCDGCKDYVKAWKRLTVKHAPNILTIALKRFQSGRFGKLNKRVAFPETLNLSSYMSDAGDGSNIYKLYAVVVHIDMLNASYFGHYICYIKDFQGNWYMIDDWKVTRVDLEEVLSQGAYMLLYSRLSAQPSGLQIQTTKPSQIAEGKTVEVEVKQGPGEDAECLSNREDAQVVTCNGECEGSPSYISPGSTPSSRQHESSTITNSDAKSEHSEEVDMVVIRPTGSTNVISCSTDESSYMPVSQTDEKDDKVMPISQTDEKYDKVMPISQTDEKDDKVASMDCYGLSPVLPNNNFSASMHCRNVGADSEVIKCKVESAKENAYYGNANKSSIPAEDAGINHGNAINEVRITGDKLIM